MIGKIPVPMLAAALAAALLAQGPSVQTRVDHLATALNLTDAQKTKAVPIYTDALNASSSLEASMHDNRQALADAVKKNDTGAITTLSATSGNLSGQLTAINAKADAAFYAILTADQQTKYDSMRHGGPGGPGGHAGPNGGRGFGAGRFGPPRQ
jgi:Spy/CpxP family protein refolding chaperone